MTIRKGISPRLPEIGRLRSGVTKTAKKKGKDVAFPVSLETWRLTTSHLEALNSAATVFGGKVEEWTEGHGSQYQLITDSPVLPVLVPPQDLSAGQYFEFYSRGGVLRRCDGETELVSGDPCLCDVEGERKCAPTTHLSVLLPALEGLGTWRHTTQSYFAAAELQASIAILDAVREKTGETLVGAELVIEPRQRKTGGETHNFVVPVLRTPYALADVGLVSDRPALPSDPTAGSQDESPAGKIGSDPTSDPTQGERRVESPETADAPEREVGTTSDSPPASTDEPDSAGGPEDGVSASSPPARRYPIDATECSHRYPSGRLLPFDEQDRCPKCGMPKLSALEGTTADLGP